MLRLAPHANIRFAVLAAVMCGAALAAMGAPGAQPSWVHNPWRTDDGLPNNDVTGVVQVSDGALLIATKSGLVRFDGLRFRRLEFDIPEKGVAAVSALCRGRNKAVWFINQSRLVEWRDGKTTRSHTLPAEAAGDRVTGLFMTADEAIWLGLEKEGVYCLKNDNLLPAKTEAGLEQNALSTVAMDAKGTVWAAGPGVLARWDGTQFKKVAELPKAPIAMTAARDGGLWVGAGLSLLRFKEKEGVESVVTVDCPNYRARITSVLEDSAGRVWCGTFSGGLYYWQKGYFERVDADHQDVSALMEDAERSLWVATAGGGVMRLRQRVLKLLDERQGPVNQTPRSLCIDSMNQVWVVLQSGLVQMRKPGGSWQEVDLAETLHSTGVVCAAADLKGGVWLACEENKIAVWDGSGFKLHGLPIRKSEASVHAMFVARDGSLWIGRGGELIHGLPGDWKIFPSALGRGDIVTIAQDRAGSIWAGATSGRLFRVEGGTMKSIETPRDDGGIRCLMAAPDGALWIGREQCFARLKDFRYSRLSHGKLASPGVSQMVLDDHKRVWLGVDQGMVMAPLDDLNTYADGRGAIVNYSNYLSWGYQASSDYTPNVAMASGGWLWYCSRSGVVIGNTNAAGGNTVPPRVTIEAISVNGKPVAQEPSLKFGPRPQQTQFELGAMSFRLPEQVRLYHKIDDVDSGWVLAGRDRIARYARLPAGKHTLRVRAVNEDGVASERDATLGFEVVPEFWETTLFRMSMLALCAVAAWMATRLFVRRRLKTETAVLREQAAVNDERVRIARDMHDQLGASLTQISLITDLMAGDGINDKRVAQLGRTARQASTALDEIVWAVNPSHDHLGSVLEYLGQQVVNLLEPAGLRCRLDFPSDTPERHLPADYRHQLFLIVREAINNIIKHASAKEVSFKAEITPKNLRLLIVDDGRGGAPQSGGDGLMNMRSRAASLGGECRIQSADGNGTTVELQVPWPQRPRSS